MTERLPHIFDPAMIDEVSLHMYKYPKSGLREQITNGLDEQVKLDYEHQKIEITTHVGPDDDLWIEDWGNGIRDINEFRVIGRGWKMVGGEKSSLQIVNPKITGHKGFGKVSARKLSGAGAHPEPVVEWWSHRPKMVEKDKDGKDVVIHAQGLKVTLTKDYAVEHMDSLEALPHPGCRVVIKNVKWNILPPFPKLISYIGKVYAPKLKRGTKIYFDGIRVQAPEGFISKIYPLFQLDNGESIYGNVHSIDKVEEDNVSIYIKNVLVAEYKIDNPCQIWINDDKLIPTTSREDVEGDDRYEEVKAKLQAYADEHYPIASGPKDVKMNMEREKDAMLIELMQYRDKLLSGSYDENGIEGQVVGGMKRKTKWVRRDNVTLTNTGGDENGQPIIPIGPGIRDSGKRKGGENGPHPSIEDGGIRSVLEKESDVDRQKLGTIKPQVTRIVYPFQKIKPMAWLEEGAKIYWNTSWRYTVKALKASGKDWAYIVAPLYAQAMVKFDKEEFEQIDGETWEKRYSDYLEHMLEKRKIQ
jgi:hypothetical protein